MSISNECKKSINSSNLSEEHELYVLFISEKTFTDFEHEKNIRKDDISHLFPLIEKRQLKKETF